MLNERILSNRNLRYNNGHFNLYNRDQRQKNSQRNLPPINRKSYYHRLLREVQTPL